MFFRSAVLMAMLALPAGAQAPRAWTGSYPEGPVWIAGDLFWAEMYADRVRRWSGGEPATFLDVEGCGPTAIAAYREDEFIVLCHLAGTLLRVSADGTVLATFDTGRNGARLRNPNDASADGAGGVWFTDPGRFSSTAPAEGAVYHLSAAGVLERHVTGLAYGNGVHVDAGANRLLVSEHLAQRVLSYPLSETGLGEPDILVDLADLGLPTSQYPETGPDGLEIGPDGTLWIAQYGATRLIGWHPERGLVATLQVDPQFVTNIAFSPDGLAALTGAYENSKPPYRGATWVFPADVLTRAAAAE